MLGVPIFLLTYFLLWLISIFCFAGVLPFFEGAYPLLAAALFWIGFKKTSDQEELPTSKGPKFILCILAALLALFLWQLVGLPQALLQWSAPLSFENTFGFFSRARLEPLGRYPISLDPDSTISSIKLFIGFAGLLCAAMLLPRDYKTKEKAGLAFIYACLGFSILGVVHLFSGSQKVLWMFSKGYTFFGPYLNKNHAGALVTVAAILCFSLIFSRSMKAQRTKFLAIFSFFVFTLLFIGSRAGIATTFLFCGLHTFMGIKIFSKRQLLLGFAAFAAVLFFSVLWNAAFFYRLFPKTEFRLSFWRYALDIWKSAPIFGTGLGSFSAISPRFLGTSQWVHPEHVENDFLELLCTCGSLGFLLALGFLQSFIRQSARTYASKKSHMLSKGFSLCFLAFLFHSAFVFHAPVAAQHFLFCFLVYGILPESSFVFSHRLKKTLGVSMLTLSMACIGHSLFVYQVEPDPFASDKALVNASIGSAKNFQAMLLLKQDEYEQMKATFRQKPYLTQPLYEYAKLELFFGEPDRALVLAQEAIDRAPLDLPKRLMMTEAFANKGYFPQAEKWSNDLLSSKAPLSIRLRSKINLDLAFSLLLSKKQEEARSYVNQAFAIAPHDWEVLLYKAFLDAKPAPGLFTQSWKQFTAQETSPMPWDSRFFELAKLHELDPFQVLSSLAYVRPQVAFLLPKNKPLALWPVDHPGISLQLKGNPSNYRWDGTNLKVDIINHSSELDMLLLPIELEAPDNLHVRMIVRYAGKKMEGRLVYLSKEANVEKKYISETQAVKLDGQRWKFEMPVAAQSITGIAFSPMEKDGVYAVESIEIFVNS